MAIFRNSILTMKVLRYERMPKEIFVVRNRITLQAAILDCSEAAVQSHPFSKIFPENTDGSFTFKLQIVCSEYRLCTKMTPARMFSWKSSESFWSA